MAQAASTTYCGLAQAVPLGSCVAGIPIKLHWSFFLLLLLELISSFLNFNVEGNKYPMLILLIVVLYGPVLLLTILVRARMGFDAFDNYYILYILGVHEFGHCLTTRKLGGTVDGILLWPLGGLSFLGPANALEGDLKVALAGPMTHIPMGFLWWAIYAAAKGPYRSLWPANGIFMNALSTPSGFFASLSAQALYMNIILFFFNLLIPGGSTNLISYSLFFSSIFHDNGIIQLDGGRVFAACLILKFNYKNVDAAKVTAITAMVISAGMVLYAIISFVASPYGFELFFGLVGCIVFYASHQLWTAAKLDDLCDHPIFGRKCYQDNIIRNLDDVENNDGEAPAAPPAQAQNDQDGPA
ncbi:hypothetical protein ACHAW5_010412 [Stephanodiscus triporus]|uniref:Peptidase M50 domain-containing protein n=1 Tax=Stephanodiscus triporus TaxID=2934178 RepID=A0ABD3PA04_9STRA